MVKSSVLEWYRTFKIRILKCSEFECIRNSNVRYSSPHCIFNLTPGIQQAFDREEGGERQEDGGQTSTRARRTSQTDQRTSGTLNRLHRNLKFSWVIKRYNLAFKKELNAKKAQANGQNTEGKRDYQRAPKWTILRRHYRLFNVTKLC